MSILTEITSTNTSKEQFRSDLKAVFSTVIEHVPHEDHLGLYGGVCSIDEPYREIAIDEAAIHRQANASKPMQNGVTCLSTPN